MLSMHDEPSEISFHERRAPKALFASARGPHSLADCRLPFEATHFLLTSLTVTLQIKQRQAMKTRSQTTQCEHEKRKPTTHIRMSAPSTSTVTILIGRALVHIISSIILHPTRNSLRTVVDARVIVI